MRLNRCFISLKTVFSFSVMFFDRFRDEWLFCVQKPKGGPLSGQLMCMAFTKFSSLDVDAC